MSIEMQLLEGVYNASYDLVVCIKEIGVGLIVGFLWGYAVSKVLVTKRMSKGG